MKELGRSRLGWPAAPAVAPRHSLRSTPPPTPAPSGSAAPSGLVGAPAPSPSTTGVSRGTTDDSDGGTASGAPGAVSATDDAPVAPDPTVSRETASIPAQAAPEEIVSESTPLAAAVQKQLQLRRGLLQRESLPRPDRARVMVVANQKGGVGKTTTAVNLAAGLAQGGLRVLVIDLDPQGNASTALAVEHTRGTLSTYDALVDGVPLSEVAQPCEELPGLMVVPATIDLAGAEIELVSVVARENRLRKAILGWDRVSGDGEDRFDYVLIDCPPSLGLLTLNALVAAEELLLPIQAEYYALEGVGQLLETVELVRANLNPRLRISTVLLTMYDGRTRLSAAVADEVRGHFGDRVLSTAIPRAVRVSEAPSYAQTVMTYDPASSGALSYREAARELAQQVEKKETEPHVVAAGSQGGTA
ncbi:AAA family ATPase [Nocardioides sp. HDW12B]|nr:AAA family ATPase [Nocardioides sp. HDW12B]